MCTVPTLSSVNQPDLQGNAPKQFTHRVQVHSYTTNTASADGRSDRPNRRRRDPAAGKHTAHGGGLNDGRVGALAAEVGRAGAPSGRGGRGKTSGLFFFLIFY